MNIIHQQVAAILVFTKYLYICRYNIYIRIYIYICPLLSIIIPYYPVLYIHYISIVINYYYPLLSSIIYPVLYIHYYPLLSIIIPYYPVLYIHYYPLLSDYYPLLSIIVHYYPLHPWLSILIHYQALFNVSNGKMIPTNQSVSRGDELYDHHPVDEPPEIGHPLGMTRTTRWCHVIPRPSGGPSGGTWVALVPCCWASISLSHSGAVDQRRVPVFWDRWGRLQFLSNGAKQDILKMVGLILFTYWKWSGLLILWAIMGSPVLTHKSQALTHYQMVWWQATIAFEGWFFGTANAGLDSVWEVDGFRSSMFFSGWSFWLIIQSFLPWSLAALTWQWKCSKP